MYGVGLCPLGIGTRSGIGMVLAPPRVHAARSCRRPGISPIDRAARGP